MTTFPDVIPTLKYQINSQFFMETIIMTCWAIWTARNELIFIENGTSRDDHITIFFKELNHIRFRLKQDQQPQFDSWINHLESLAAQSRFSSLPFLFLESFVFFCFLQKNFFSFLINKLQGVKPLQIPKKKINHFLQNVNFNVTLTERKMIQIRKKKKKKMMLVHTTT